jgi:hypothetical protein
MVMQPAIIARVKWGSKNRVKMYQFDLRGSIKEVSR